MAVTLKQTNLVFSMVSSIILFDFALFGWVGGGGVILMVFRALIGDVVWFGSDPIFQNTLVKNNKND